MSAAETMLNAGGLATEFTSVSPEQAVAHLQALYGLTGTVKRLDTEKDDTFLLTAPEGRFIAKFANPDEDPRELDLQAAALRHIASADPTLPVPRVIPSRQGAAFQTVTDAAGQPRMVRMLSYLEGTPLDRIEASRDEREKVGAILARLRLALAGFSHPHETREIAWDVQHLARLEPLIAAIPDAGHRRLLAEGMARYKALAPRLAECRWQVLHNDFSRSNLVVDRADPGFITGVIDFGDVLRTAIVIDVSTAMLNQLHPEAGPAMFDRAFDVLRGYLASADLTATELDLLPHMIMARVIARALITTWRAGQFPANETYILRNTHQGWAQLAQFLAMPAADLSALFHRAAAIGKQDLPISRISWPRIEGRLGNADPALPERTTPPMTDPSEPKINIGMVNGFDPATLSSLPAETQDQIRRRQRLLGPAYRLMYAAPVEVARGQGTLLWDSAGNDYLDAYNNVVPLGHCHPRVVAAVHEQMQTLVTHTRYIQQGILDFAEEFVPTFGAPIEHVMFTCSGSEANDLALQIAMHHTGRRGLIVTSEAYTGNSFLTAHMSPALGKHRKLGAWVRRIPTPDSYRLTAQEIGDLLVERVRYEIEEFERKGDGIAAFIADSLFSSDGIYAQPTDLLARIAKVVHAAGGVVIADEVQAGFGRSGEAFWGYQRHGQRPDIVTMGKPMGNGYPVAAVALAPHVIAKFGREMRYFNTFGGNGVAMAAARATFQTIRDENLQDNAAKVGAMIQSGLREIAAECGRIGDVRGAGLYVGVEFVTDLAAKTPDSATALAVVDGMRRRRVLISATGAHSATLKIRPPLVFSPADADRLLTSLRATLKEMPV